MDTVMDIPTESPPEVPTLTLEQVTQLSGLQEARDLYNVHIPAEKMVAEGFWESFGDKEKLIGYKAVLAAFVTSGKIPRQFQLRATIALCCRKDVLVDAGTGSGKTLCMVLCALLHRKCVSIVISPLKKLQEMQVLEFRSYGISTLAINEETPSDKQLWKDIATCVYAVLVVQAEQFFMHNGHWPRLSRLLHKPDFLKLVRLLFVDEAHSIYTAGIDLYGRKAFRPAWGYLSQLRAKLGSKVSVAGFSGTLPNHIKAVVVQHLQLREDRTCAIQITGNRPNIAYATHGIVGSLSDYRNLDFLIQNLSVSNTEGSQRRKGIVFHDSIESAVGAKNFQEQQLPAELRGKGFIKTFYSLMSREYLKQTYDDFRDPNGRCTILHATEAASTGLDVQDIHWVVQYGLPRELTMMLQHAGRCGRDGATASIFLLMFESWAKTYDLHEAQKEEAHSDSPLDPDHPICGNISDKSNKQGRTGVSMFKLVQMEDHCIRQTFASYNNDTSENALTYTGPFCCSSSAHTEKLDFSCYFPGKLLYQDATTKLIYSGSPTDPDRKPYIVPSVEKRKATPRYRLPVKQRTSLESRLAKWRYSTWKKDKHRSMRPPYLIISDSGIQAIARLHPNDITDFRQITLILGETPEWETKYAHSVIKIIQDFDDEVAQMHEARKIEREENRKRQKLEKAEQQVESDRKAFSIDTMTTMTRLTEKHQYSLQPTARIDINEARRRLQELNEQDARYATSGSFARDKENRHRKAVEKAMERSAEARRSTVLGEKLNVVVT